MKSTILITLFIVFGFYMVSVADELHVPLPYGTIQAAIDDANDGDVIIVSDGTYTGAGNKNLDFAGKTIRNKRRFRRLRVLGVNGGAKMRRV